MIVSLEFELPKDKEELEVAEKGQDLYFTLYNFDQWLRYETKYLPYDEDYRRHLQMARDKLYEIMDEKGVHLDMMS
jgi:hypothetical protein